MAQLYYNLEVYKLTLDLLLMLYKDRAFAALPRDLKYTLLQDMKKDGYKLMRLIYKANLTTDKCPILMEAREIIEGYKMYIHLLRELGVFTAKSYFMYVEQVNTVSKQLTGWYKYSESRKGKNS